MNKLIYGQNAFLSYLGASSLWTAGMTLQTFLFTTLLVVILERPADETGIARMLAELPPLVVLLFGGLLGDRFDQRRTLLLMHTLMTLPPLLILGVYLQGALSYGWVVLFGALIMSLQALSDPTRQAMLSRVASLDIQRSVSIMTIVTSLVGLGGLALGTRLERWGLANILGLQALLFAAGLVLIARLPALPPLPRPNGTMDQPRSRRLARGLRAVAEYPLIRSFLGLNFLSSLFNAGAYIVAMPYIITQEYGGDSTTLAQAMIVFTLGSIASNIILLKVMPLARPGRLFLLMQLSRVLILGLMFLRPPASVFYALLIAWGLNMGVTTTMVRSSVQALAPADERTQILSVLLLSFMVSAPISAILLGYLIAGASPLAALLPALVISLLIFFAGRFGTPLWHYDAFGKQSPWR